VDAAVPIVFPDYLIAVPRPEIRVDVPDFVPWLPNEIVVRRETYRVPDLGHAGILFLQGSNGLTKYYEYGRYDPAARGLVRHVAIPDVRMHSSGRPTRRSLANTLGIISLRSGQSGRLVGAYIELPAGSFTTMLRAAQTRERANSNPRRTPYDLLTNSCLHFMRDIAVAGGASMPAVVVPTPVSYMSRVHGEHPDLGFSRPVALTIEGITLP
jgi:hypothetical protein